MEKLLERLNGLGKYQVFLLLLIGLISILSAFTVFSSIFTAGQHRIICTNNADNTTLSDSCQGWTNLKKSVSKEQSDYRCRLSHEYYGNTMINEWGFQCQEITKASMVTTVFMFGMLFTFVGGWLGDKYGRRFVCVGSIIGLNFASVASEILISKFQLDVKTQYLIYVVSQFFLGFLGKN